MNYYERHIGDYAKNAAHLSLLEHGVYARLMDVYYVREGPIPDNRAARLIGAATPETLQALQDVLQEFFELRDGLWHQDRCDEEIEAYRQGEPEREVKKANEDNRLKRHRDERANLFKIITDAGEHAPWNIGISELRKLADRCVAGVAGLGPETQPATAPATAPATPATATQYPLPTTQYLKEPPTPKGAEGRFARFWSAYPKKVGKDAALKAFLKRKPDEALTDAMVKAVRAQASSQAWTKDGGQFIPNPATWLNQGRWQDESQAGGQQQSAGGVFEGAL